MAGFFVYIFEIFMLLLGKSILLIKYALPNIFNISNLEYAII